MILLYKKRFTMAKRPTLAAVGAFRTEPDPPVVLELPPLLELLEPQAATTSASNVSSAMKKKGALRRAAVFSRTFSPR